MLGSEDRDLSDFSDAAGVRVALTGGGASVCEPLSVTVCLGAMPSTAESHAHASQHNYNFSSENAFTPSLLSSCVDSSALATDSSVSAWTCAQS